MEKLELLKNLAICIERGKVDINSKHPADMQNLPGAVEYTKQALEMGIDVTEILELGLIAGMNVIGERFSKGKAYIPDLMISSKAMTEASKLLQPYFTNGKVKYKGSFIIGTVKGDHHDIGKNIIKMALEGNGYKVIDLGSNVSTEKFLEAIETHPNAPVGMSALLTTTMQNMALTVKAIKEIYPNVKIFIGGAPVNEKFNNEIGADGYYPSPFQLIKALDKLNCTNEL